MSKKSNNTGDTDSNANSNGWTRREWIKVVGVSTVGMMALGLPAAASEVKFINGELYISRQKYASHFGPTVGDKIRLADTELFAEIEKDFETYGEENKFGGGKNIRDGMGQSARALDKDTLDMVILGATVIDHWGIVKGDIGIKDGKIVGVGKAGNPDVQDGVSPNMVIGASTEVHSGWGYIVTAGGLDTHIHYICPQIVETALSNGLTTLIGGGTGPNDGTNATTATPGPFFIKRMLQAVEGLPINFGFLAKGNTSSEAAIEEQIKAGAIGIKIHEDWGSTPSVIDASLNVADRHDVQVAIHTDTINEAGYLETTVKAIGDRVIHSFHTEGAGGGHAPDIMAIAQYKNVLPSSTDPTMPYTINTAAEHLDMLMICHHLNPNIKEDVAFADSRIRPTTIGAEDILHDMGAISMMSSDALAMGRIGECVLRTWQTAHKMKLDRGPLSKDGPGNDNYRIKRYVAKYTINPAIANGIDSYVGSIEPGKIADLVVWRPDFFGVKPELIYKAGVVVHARMGDANASIPTPQPVIYRNMYGAFGNALAKTNFNFVSKASMDSGNIKKLGLKRTSLPVKGCRTISKKDMAHNSATPKIDIDPETYEVRINGKLAKSEPLKEVPMAQRYLLF